MNFILRRCLYITNRNEERVVYDLTKFWQMNIVATGTSGLSKKMQLLRETNQLSNQYPLMDSFLSHFVYLWGGVPLKVMLHSFYCDVAALLIKRLCNYTHADAIKRKFHIYHIWHPLNYRSRGR